MELFPLISLILHKLPFLILGVLGIGIVITVHELGHFIFGKLFNVHIPEFSIGMGPKIYSKKIGETTFCLSLIPVGAYVAADQDPETAGGYERTMQAKSYWQKCMIVGGGIAFNLIFAYTLLVGLSMTGIPANPLFSGAHYVEKVIPASPAAAAGIVSNDIIVAANGIATPSIETLLTVISENPGQDVTFSIQRGETTIQLPCTLDVKDEGSSKVGSLGVQFSFKSLPALSFMQSTTQSWRLLTTLVTKNFMQLKSIFKKKSAKNFAGPLGMVYMALESASQGIMSLLVLLVLINIGLAVLNVLPIPILDGGHLLVYTIEAIIGRPLNETFQMYLSYAALTLFALLFCYLTFQDSLRIFFS